MVSPICCDEPSGIVMIEAIACGIPVVALNRRSVPEVAADGEPRSLRDDSAAMAAGYERIYRTAQETGGLAFKRRATG
jgi:glycosyltransferase involved in cell wall biosynthesis